MWENLQIFNEEGNFFSSTHEILHVIFFDLSAINPKTEKYVYIDIKKQKKSNN